MPTLEEQVVSQEQKHCLTVFVHVVGEDDFIEYFVALDAHENLVDIGPGYAVPEDLAALDDDIGVRAVRADPSPLEGLGEVGLATLPDFGLGARLALPVLEKASSSSGEGRSSLGVISVTFSWVGARPGGAKSGGPGGRRGTR